MSGIKIFETSLRNIAIFFDEHKIDYMIIGGLANTKWGQPRATLDIDITIWMADSKIENILSLLKEEHTILVDNPFEFITKTRVLPLKNSENQRIDLIFGSLPFEKNAIDRAAKVHIGNKTVNFCTAEDLILFKIISDRHKDIEDVRGILKFQKEKLDFDYLEPRILELSTLLDKPEIKLQWERWKRDLLNG